MKSIKYFLVLLTFQFAFSLALFCQSFEVSTLIDIPGDNLEFDVLSPSYFEPTGETYICWINKIDSIYTVYLKQISPNSGEILEVFSANSTISNPQIALCEDGIKVAWQYQVNNIWMVYAKVFQANQFGELELLLDSLNSDPEISLGNNKIAWVNNGNLYLREFYPNSPEYILLDSVNCTSPDLAMNWGRDDAFVLYVKDYTDSSKINLLQYYVSGFNPPVFNREILSTGIKSNNPTFGFDYSIAFQTFEDGVWRLEYSPYDWMLPSMSTNLLCNYYNPIYFSYPIPTSSPIYTPFFVVFDTDSLVDNNEIFINAFYQYTSGQNDSLINLSQSPGNDYKPKVSYLFGLDSAMISIIWLHSENNKTDFWIAKDKFNPVPGDVEDENNNPFRFIISQNYPNPFNPTTIIHFELLRTDFVSLKVFDLLGNEVAMLVNEEKSIGNYNVEFNASNLSSGVYYYQLKSGGFIETKKMLLLK
ncbi:MAG: T9SS type A sorting domain-containing protein [Ignavibacteriaceae bacterium]